MQLGALFENKSIAAKTRFGIAHMNSQEITDVTSDDIMDNDSNVFT